MSQALRIEPVDSEAEIYRTPAGLSVTRLQPVIGAEIAGLDAARDIPAAVARDLKQALLDHGVIFLRDQALDDAHHLALGEIFGEVLTSDKPIAGRPQFVVLKAAGGAKDQSADEWHSDGTYLPVPPSVTILRAAKASPLGGDTCYASAGAAYDGLPEEVKARIADLRSISSMAYIVSRMRSLGDASAETRVALVRNNPPVDQPVVRVHPETGRRLIYLNESHTSHIIGLEPAESRELMRYLIDQFRRPEYQCRFKWRDNSVAIWDNRAVQHYAVPNQLSDRHMERITIAGTRALGIAEAESARA